jgi:hypothetical protein
MVVFYWMCLIGDWNLWKVAVDMVISLEVLEQGTLLVLCIIFFCRFVYCTTATYFFFLAFCVLFLCKCVLHYCRPNCLKIV